MNKITISLTTISSRLNNVHHVLRSLIEQDFQACPFTVQLYLSNHPYLLDEGCPQITQELESLRLEYPEKLSIHYVDNTGPYRKIIPALKNLYTESLEEFSNSLIVTADDDSIYPPYWLAKLYEFYKMHNCITGFRGRSMVFKKTQLQPYQTWSKNISVQKSILNLPTGKDGVLYSPLHLHPDVLNLENAIKYAPKADDLWLKVHSLLNNVKNIIINDDLSDEFPSVSGQEPEVSLYNNFNKKGGNDTALEKLELYLAIEHGTNLCTLCHDKNSPSNVAAQSLRQLLKV